MYSSLNEQVFLRIGLSTIVAPVSWRKKGEGEGKKKKKKEKERDPDRLLVLPPHHILSSLASVRRKGEKRKKKGRGGKQNRLAP